MYPDSIRELLTSRDGFLLEAADLVVIGYQLGLIYLDSEPIVVIELVIMAVGLLYILALIVDVRLHKVVNLFLGSC